MLFERRTPRRWLCWVTADHTNNKITTFICYDEHRIFYLWVVNEIIFRCSRPTIAYWNVRKCTTPIRYFPIAGERRKAIVSSVRILWKSKFSDAAWTEMSKLCWQFVVKGFTDRRRFDATLLNLNWNEIFWSLKNHQFFFYSCILHLQFVSI